MTISSPGATVKLVPLLLSAIFDELLQLMPDALEANCTAPPIALGTLKEPVREMLVALEMTTGKTLTTPLEQVTVPFVQPGTATPTVPAEAGLAAIMITAITPSPIAPMNLLLLRTENLPVTVLAFYEFGALTS
jgi:hypothetical protein